MSLQEVPTPASVPTSLPAPVSAEPEGTPIVVPDGSTVVDGDQFDPNFTNDGESVPVTGDGELTKEGRDKAIREVYAIATAELRALHQGEFNKLRQDLLAERGIEWKPPMTKLEKAQAELAKAQAELEKLQAQS